MKRIFWLSLDSACHAFGRATPWIAWGRVRYAICCKAAPFLWDDES